MTRTRDKDFGGVDADDDINERVKYINEKYSGKGIDVLLSIHVNTDSKIKSCWSSLPNWWKSIQDFGSKSC